MKNEGKIVGLFTDMLIKQDSMVEELRDVKSEVTKINVELDKVNGELGKLNGKVGELNGEVVKLNLQSAENTRAILKIADRVEAIADLDNRVSKLEKVVYK